MATHPRHTTAIASWIVLLATCGLILLRQLPWWFHATVAILALVSIACQALTCTLDPGVVPPSKYPGALVCSWL